MSLLPYNFVHKSDPKDYDNMANTTGIFVKPFMIKN